MVLEACLGMSVDAWTRTVHIHRPELPGGVDRLVVRGLEIAGVTVSLAFERVGDRIAVTPAAPVPDTVRVLVQA